MRRLVGRGTRCARASTMFERLNQPISFKRPTGAGGGSAPPAAPSRRARGADRGGRRRRSRTLVGLDIEPEGVVAVKSSLSGRLVVERAGFVPLGPDVVRDGEVADVEALGAALEQLFNTTRLDRRVRIGIANQRIVMRRIQLPPLTDSNEIEHAVQFQAQDEIPMPLDSVVLDYHTLGISDSGDGPRLNIMLVAARRDMVERVLAAARMAGLQPEGVDLSAFGMMRALRPADVSSDEQVLYLSVGALTNLAVGRAGVCEFTRVIAVGTEQIVADIRARSGLGLVQARELLAATGVSGALGGVGGAVVEPAVVRAAAAVPAPPAVPAVQVEPGMAVAPIVVEPAMAVEQPVAVEPLAAAPPVVAAPAAFEPPSFPPLPSTRPNDKYLSPAAPALAFWPAGPSVADLAALGPVQPHEPYISERDFAAPVAATPPAVPVAPAPIAPPAGEVAQPVTPATTAMAPAADSVHATVPVEHAEPAPVVTSARAAYAEPRAESVVPETASPSHDDPAEAARTALIEGIRRIAVEVRNSLEFYVAQGREPVTRAVLCGPALQIEGFDAALSRELGIPVTQGTVALASPRSAGSVPRGMLAVAAGLSVIEGPQ